MAERLLVIEGAMPADLCHAAAVDAMARAPRCNEMRHPFEPKLVIPKPYDTGPLSVLIAMMHSGTVVNLVRRVFDVPVTAPEHDHFTAAFIYRTGDYLQRHLDCAIFAGDRKTVTMNLYLSECQGGEIVYNGTAVPVRPNLLVAFANDDAGDHSVSPVLSGQRIAITTGLVTPASMVLPGFTTQNERAFFLPEDGEHWTPEQIAMRDARAVWSRTTATYCPCGQDACDAPSAQGRM